jgi:hypothetical protein
MKTQPTTDNIIHSNLLNQEKLVNNVELKLKDLSILLGDIMESHNEVCQELIS